MQGWILRGQGYGFMHDRVFLTYPTEADFKAALVRELTKHGAQIAYSHDSTGKMKATVSEPTKQWVRVEVVDVVAPPGFQQVPEPSEAEKAARPTIMYGYMDEASHQALVALASGTSLTGTAAVAPIVMQGYGTVTNPEPTPDPVPPSTPTIAAL